MIAESDDAEALVVDTDVVSYVFRGDTRAEPFRSMLAGRVLIVSFMTIAELERWALARDWGPARMRALERFLGRFVLPPFDRTLCRRWAEVMDGAQRQG
jgi:tRNA(fMet)-specific endonuclease VapC